jgi:hypothetical protein
MPKLAGIAAFAIVLWWSGVATAACTCACVDGKTEEICTNAVDAHHVCVPHVCPLAPSHYAPIEPARIPPHGMSTCRMAQVYSEKLGRYEWQRVCKE